MLRAYQTELSYNITSANYQSTWQALEIRYYNPRAIIAKLFREFYSTSS
jgi:hypothetical protein